LKSCKFLIILRKLNNLHILRSAKLVLLGQNKFRTPELLNFYSLGLAILAFKICCQSSTFCKNHMDFDVKTFLANLSTKPGVYQMFDSRHTVLYVGKAKNLKKRVASYFNTSANHSLKTKTKVGVCRIS